MAAENISQSQFADTIGVARASVSHILAGRNKPGFDFIESMARNFPDVNLEWIITGKGKMYKSASPKPEKTAIPDDLFAPYDEDMLQMHSGNIKSTSDLNDESTSKDNISSRQSESTRVPLPKPHEESPAKPDHNESITSLKSIKTINNQRNILKIVIFYDDNTYQELK